jgi:UDP:flavonoid glycosyltransferase YjiC (YdhE family)
MGHLSRCLAYARRMQGRARPFFFSLASAVEIIHDMGFDADYFVSESWSRTHINAWNRELAIRVGLMLEEVTPAAVVFDGTWPFHGFMAACDNYGVDFRVWSNRGMHRSDFNPVPVDESAFDLVIQPGEIGARFTEERAERPGRKVTTQPVTLLRRDELPARDAARDALGLKRDGRYALFSLGSFQGVDDIAPGLIDEMRKHGFTVVWARAPISVADMLLPDDVISISVYPLVRYMRAFDVFVGAAGYNTCCEVIQTAVPSLLVPNPMAADDQARRADIASRYAPVVVFSGETGERHSAVSRLLEFCRKPVDRPTIQLDGAERAADEILSLVREQAAA